MANINFPSNPSVGQLYDFGAYRYRYDGEKWTTIPTNGQTINQAMDAHKSGLNQHAIGGIVGLQTALDGIVSSGSNVNGSWIKFADGTLICTVQHGVICNQLRGNRWGTTSGDGYVPIDSTWVFPMAFIAAPRCHGSPSGVYDHGGGQCHLSNPTTTQAVIRAWCVSSGTMLCDYFAIGRWK